jgi:hypothetical protein
VSVSSLLYPPETPEDKFFSTIGTPTSDHPKLKSRLS